MPALALELALGEVLVVTPLLEDSLSPPRPPRAVPCRPSPAAAIAVSTFSPPLPLPLPLRRLPASSLLDLSARFFLHSASRFARESAIAAAVAEASPPVPAAAAAAPDLERVVLVLVADAPRTALVPEEAAGRPVELPPFDDIEEDEAVLSEIDRRPAPAPAPALPSP